MNIFLNFPLFPLSHFKIELIIGSWVRGNCGWFESAWERLIQFSKCHMRDPGDCATVHCSNLVVDTGLYRCSNCVELKTHSQRSRISCGKCK